MKIKYIVAAAIFTAQTLALPFISTVQAAGVEMAFNYDSNPDSVTAMSKAADKDEGSSSFASSSILVRGGFFGDGAKFNYMRRLNDGYGYQYSYNYYCIDGKPQLTKPDGQDKDIYKLEASVYLMLEKDFNTKDKYDNDGGHSSDIGSNKFDSGISRIDMTGAKSNNAVSKNATVSNGGKPVALGSGYGDGLVGKHEDNDGNRFTMKESCLAPRVELGGSGAMINLQSDRITPDVRDSWLQTKKVAKETTTSGGDDDGNNKPNCDMQLTSPISWIVCPVIDAGAAMSDWVFTSIVKPLLADVPISTDRDDPGYKVWQNFRVLGNVLLIGSLLAVVYSQARGGK